MKDLKKKYEDIDLQRQKSTKEVLENKIADSEQKIIQLNVQVTKLQRESQELKENAVNQARQEVQEELHDKDIE